MLHRWANPKTLQVCLIMRDAMVEQMQKQSEILKEVEHMIKIKGKQNPGFSRGFYVNQNFRYSFSESKLESRLIETLDHFPPSRVESSIENLHL